MADIGYRLLQTVTSTLCEQCGPVIGEPQAAPTNSHFQFGTHMGGGTLHWQAAGNGGPLTVTFLPGSSSSTTPPPPVAPTPLSLPPIEDRAEVTSLPIPILSPFPGPIITGKGLGKAPPFVSNQSPELAPPANTTVSEEPRPQDGPSGVLQYGKIDRWILDKGFGFVVADDGGGDVFCHRSAIQPEGLASIQPGARVSFTRIFDSRKNKYRVDAINFLPPNQPRPRQRHPSRSPYRSSSRQPRASPNVRRPRKPSSLSKRRRLTPVRPSPSPSRQPSPVHDSPPHRARSPLPALDVSAAPAALPTLHVTYHHTAEVLPSAPLPPPESLQPTIPPSIVPAPTDINSKASQITRSSMRLFAINIGRVCLKNLTTGSTTSSHVELRVLCENIFHTFNTQVSPEVMSRLFRHTSGMVSSVVDGNEVFTDGQSELIPALAHFCLNNCERLRGFPASLTSWDSGHHSYCPSEVLDFGHASGTPISPALPSVADSRSNSVVSESASATPCLPADLGDPAYYAVPVVPMDDRTLKFLHLIRVVVRDMASNLKMANPAGFVSIFDFVPLLMAWGSDVTEEQVLDVLTRFGNQFIEICYEDSILIKDRAHDTVPTVEEYKNPPTAVAAAPTPLIASPPPRTRATTIAYALRLLTSSGSLGISQSGLVDYIQLVNALGVLESSPPDPFSDLMVVYADPSFSTQTIESAVWLSHSNLPGIPLMGEEWFKEQYGQIPRIDLPLIPTPPIHDSGSFTSSCATTERATTDRPSPRPEESPFTLAGAIAAQATTEGIAATTMPSSALVIAPPEGLLDHDMESPTTSTLSSPGAAPPTVPHPTTLVEGMLPSSLVGTDPESQPMPTFPPSLPSASAPPPAPVQYEYGLAPKPVPKGRPKSKGSRAAAK